MLRPVVSSIIAVMLIAFSANAQTVRGIVSRTGTPVSGVVVQLLDEAGNVVSSNISEIDGRYRVGSTRAGTFRLSARRIGFAKHQTDLFTLTVGETREIPIDLSAIAISLDTIRVRPRACVALSRAESEVATVWEQTKTALLATDATQAGRPMATTVLRYHQIDKGDGPRLREVTVLESDSTTALWYAPSPRVMRDKGYAVVLARNTIQFWAPSLEVLTSIEFAQDHCARLDDASDATSLILTFEPTRSRQNIIDIGGRIAIDRRTAELRWLSFRYTNMVAPTARTEAGGRMEFTRLKDASWLISDWSIRVPVTDSVLSADKQRTTVATAIDIAGGRLFSARRDADTVFAIPFPDVAGVVIDSATRRLVPHARMFLREAFREATSDSVGRFSFGPLRPGAHTLQVNTAALDSLGAGSVMRLQVMDATSARQVVVPTLRQTVAGLCNRSIDEMFQMPSVLHGVVSARAADSVPTTVHATWTDTLTHAIVSVRTTTDAIGQYRFCDVPTTRSIEVHAEQGARASKGEVVTIDRVVPFRVVPMRLEERSADESPIAGLVRDSTRRAVIRATVRIDSLNLVTLTDVDGSFHFARVPHGRYRLTVRQLGYAAVDTMIEIGAVANVQLRTSRTPRLDRTADEAARSLEKFDERKAGGVGQFLTREMLAKSERKQMSDVLKDLRSTIVAPIGANGAILNNRPGVLAALSCPSAVWLDEHPLYVGGLGDPPDINAFTPQQFEAIEYYVDERQAPSEYRGFARCGVLVLHTRQ